MIEARELRIGNYTYPFDDIHLVSDKTIFRDSIKVCYKDFENTNNIQPIPLTEEWLLRLGFEREESRFGSHFYTNDFSLYTSKEGSLCFCYDNYLKHIHYVHQLQNIAFALTGEELELKE
jgi:hypothetical protein